MARAREDLALLWRRILRSPPPAGLLPRLKDRGAQDSLPQPGYVGSRYRPGGLLVIALNPGPDRTGLGQADLRQYEALRRLQDASDDQVVQRFADLMNVLTDIMPSWRIILNNGLPQILACKNMGFEEVAFLNVVKWRTEGDPGKNDLDESWLLGCQEQFTLLRPSRVLIMGRAVADWIVPKGHLGTIEYDVVPRRIGDSSMDPRAQEVIAKFRADTWRPALSDGLHPNQVSVSPQTAGVQHWNSPKPTRSNISYDQIITLTISGNPKRGLSYHRFALYKNGMTVREYCDAVNALGRDQAGKGLPDIKWDLQRNFINLSNPRFGKAVARP